MLPVLLFRVHVAEGRIDLGKTVGELGIDPKATAALIPCEIHRDVGGSGGSAKKLGGNITVTPKKNVTGKRG